MFKEKILGIVLAGGAGKKLDHLTSDIRAQAAVPFGGKYRIIDFVLSNMFNSQIKKIYVLIQHKSISLLQHIDANWSSRFGTKDEFIRVTGPMPPYWQKGTADSVYQNLSRIKIERPDYVAVFAGDHVYRMDIGEMVDFHKEQKADLTICAMEAPAGADAERFGVIEKDDRDILVSFQEKPKNAKENAKRWISMGNYIFNKDLLIDILEEDARRDDGETKHDFGRDIIPALLKRKNLKICVYNFGSGKSAYWRDIESLDSYYSASMDLLGDDAKFDLTRRNWPLYSTNTDNLAPAKFCDGQSGETTTVRDSIVCDGSVIHSSRIEKSILSPSVYVDSGSSITGSILLNEVKVGKNCTIEKAVIDKRVTIPDNTVIRQGKISANAKHSKGDRAKHFFELFEELSGSATVTKEGVTVIPCYHDYQDRICSCDFGIDI